MTKVYNYKDNQPIVWFNKRLDKSNQYCLYCGVFIGLNSGVESNKEHLIAREFVPASYFESTDFNFIFRCCVICNNKKSNIERHVSTTTLINSDSRDFNESINDLALNKASKDYYPEGKGEFVIDSSVEINFEFNSSIMNSKFGFIAPPQSKESYVMELAYRHIQGIFSLCTSEFPLSREGTSFLSLEYFHVLGVYPKNDWGNEQIEYFIERTEAWPSVCDVSAAQGFFKVLMVKSTEEEGGWFWALEWNKSMRVLGAIISNENISNVYSNVPELNWSPWIKVSSNETCRHRRQAPLRYRDRLFRENSA